jgi:hypothetical protein
MIDVSMSTCVRGVNVVRVHCLSWIHGDVAGVQKHDT